MFPVKNLKAAFIKKELHDIKNNLTVFLKGSSKSKVKSCQETHLTLCEFNCFRLLRNSLTSLVEMTYKNSFSSSSLNLVYTLYTRLQYTQAVLAKVEKTYLQNSLNLSYFLPCQLSLH